ncbi:hypothetical protein TcWFU_001103 [Taenia crassiceps]|uniref:Uncharacterized protein n=1 Tax=Taenia crassiceps TaxID=6207 RepID=A0ABR4Q593_9CEST
MHGGVTRSCDRVNSSVGGLSSLLSAACSASTQCSTVQYTGHLSLSMGGGLRFTRPKPGCIRDEESRLTHHTASTFEAALVVLPWLDDHWCFSVTVSKFCKPLAPAVHLRQLRRFCRPDAAPLYACKPLYHHAVHEEWGLSTGP